MATETYQHSSFGGGAVRIEFDRNTANNRVSQVRCINNSAYAAAFRVFESGAQVYPAGGGWAMAPANQTTSWNTGGITISWDTVDGGLLMGNYSFFAGWPA